MPENMRQASVRFKTLCDDILVYSKKHHRDFRSVEIRLKKVAAEFGERPADKIKPAEIDAWLSRVTKTPATSNRYLFHHSCCRLTCNGKNHPVQHRLTIRLSPKQLHSKNLNVRNDDGRPSSDGNISLGAGI